MPEIYFKLRECWLPASNLRISCLVPERFGEPELHAIVLESINVPEKDRRQGLCRALIDRLCDDPRFEMVIVEAVQNPILAEALLRWGWDCDPGVMDFYKKRLPPETPR